MDMSEVDRMTQAERGGELRSNEPMRKHTSWRVGGVAQRAYFPDGLDDLVQFGLQISSASIATTTRPAAIAATSMTRPAQRDP